LKSNGKTERVVRRTLANGTVKEYRYAAAKTEPPVAEAVGASLAVVVAAWQRSIEWKALSPKTQENYVIYLRPFFGLFKQFPIAHLQRQQILGMRDAIAVDRGNGAAINFCRTISAFFSWAFDRQYIHASPAIKLAKKIPRGHLPAWREDQAQLAMRELPEPDRRVVVLAYYTGQRRGDLAKLRWVDYDERRGLMRLTQEKTDEPLEIPVFDELKAELSAWKAERSTVTILEYQKKPWRPVFISRRLPQQLERIGLPPLGVHGLRRLTAIRLAEAGCSTHEIAAITGHRTLAMVQEYTRGVRQRGLAEVAVLRLAKTKSQQD
jgi:integrase